MTASYIMRDGTTELVREVGRRFPGVSLIRLPRNMGKDADDDDFITQPRSRKILYDRQQRRKNAPFGLI